ncbi:lysoplasmalogenase [Bizionia sp. KMM 8389]
MKLTKVDKAFILIFCLLLVTEIISDTHFTTLHYFIKPTLLMALIIFYWTQNHPISTSEKRMILGALFCSLLGDILLMFAAQSEHFFTVGLLAFLSAHILYILCFFKHRNNNLKPYFFGALLLAYACVIFYFLNGHLGNMLFPVIFYMLVILIMCIAAFLRKGEVNRISYLLVFLGAILFVISDSILALNKFYKPLWHSNISIMFTYGFAQLFIVFGLLKQR